MTDTHAGTTAATTALLRRKNYQGFGSSRSLASVSGALCLLYDRIRPS